MEELCVGVKFIKQVVFIEFDFADHPIILFSFHVNLLEIECIERKHEADLIIAK